MQAKLGVCYERTQGGEAGARTSCTCVSAHLRLCLYPYIEGQEGAETGVKMEVEGLNLTTLGKR